MIKGVSDIQSPTFLLMLNCRFCMLLSPATNFGKLQPIMSPQTNPVEWIRLNTKFVSIIAHLLLGQKSVTDTCQATKVYPVRLFLAA